MKVSTSSIIMIIITAAIFLASSSKAVIAAKEASSLTAATTWFNLGGESGYIQGIMEKASECLPSSYLVTYLYQYDNDSDEKGAPSSRILYKETENSEIREIYCDRKAGIACSMARQAEIQANKEFQQGLSEKIIIDRLPMTAAIKKKNLKPKAAATTTNNNNNNDKWLVDIGGGISVWADPTVWADPGPYDATPSVHYVKDNFSGLAKITNCNHYKQSDDAVFCTILENNVKHFQHKDTIESKKKDLKDIEDRCAYPISLQTANEIDPIINYESIFEQLDTIQNFVEEIGFQIIGVSFHEKKYAFYKALFGGSGGGSGGIGDSGESSAAVFTCPAFDNKTVCSPNVRTRIVFIKALMEEILHFFEEIGMNLKIAAGPFVAVA